MAAFQNFRSALNGFNREDVVRYIEYINNKHNNQVNQLQTEIQTLQSELTKLRNQTEGADELREQLVQVQSQNAALEQSLAEAQEQLQKAAERPQTDNELEAYRRAERAERVARERVNQLYQQANGALAEVTVRTAEPAMKVSNIVDNVSAQLAELQTVLTSGKNSLKDAAAAMYAVRPLDSE